MFGSMENLKLNYISQGRAKTNKNRIRKTNGIIIRRNGAGIYRFEDREIITRKNEMIFIPKDIPYQFETLPGEDCLSLSIAFEADFKDPEPMFFSLRNFTESEFICNHLAPLWNLGTHAEKYKCLSLFYGLIAYLTSTEALDYSDKKRLKTIEPAINYLKKHIFDSSLSAETLHLLCGVSDTYFRKIFIANFNTTPQKYIISKRLSQAMSVIDSGHFSTVSDLAISVGYRDPLYFSRAFRKKYGLSPSEAAKQ